MSYIEEKYATKSEVNSVIQEEGFTRGGGVPVGTVIYSVVDSGSPEGWLLCNGTVYTKKDYPELWGAISNTPQAKANLEVNTTQFKTPNMVGRYVKTAQNRVGQIEEDAIRNITGRTGLEAGFSPSGPFSIRRPAPAAVDSWTTTSAKYTKEETIFDASLAVPTANENRPKTIVLEAYIKAF